MEYKIRFYTDKNNYSQVKEFIKSQGDKFKSKLYGFLEQLKIKGPTLPRPIADTLKDGIHELRIKYKGNVRILYFFIQRDQIIFSNAFVKKGSKVPESEINKAKKNRKELEMGLRRGEIELL